MTTDPSTAPRATLSQIFRRHPAGVAVVTADDGGRPVGLTVTSLTSVTPEPPCLSFNIAHSSSVWPVLARADLVGVHLLGVDQGRLAATFARSGADRFARPTRWWRDPSGIPLLHGCRAWMTASVLHRFPVGDHCIVVAAIRDCEEPGADPLLYHDRAYHGLGRPLRRQ